MFIINNYSMRVVKSPRTNDSILMKSAWFIGTAASRIHQIIIRRWFRVLFAVAVVYVLMRLAGISLTIALKGHVLLTIR